MDMGAGWEELIWEGGRRDGHLEEVEGGERVSHGERKG